MFLWLLTSLTYPILKPSRCNLVSSGRFGITPAESRIMDPQQRVVLEVGQGRPQGRPQGIRDLKGNPKKNSKEQREQMRTECRSGCQEFLSTIQGMLVDRILALFWWMGYAGYAPDSFMMTTESIPVSFLPHILARSTPASHEAMKLSFQRDTRKAASWTLWVACALSASWTSWAAMVLIVLRCSAKYQDSCSFFCL